MCRKSWGERSLPERFGSVVVLVDDDGVTGVPDFGDDGDMTVTPSEAAAPPGHGASGRVLVDGMTSVEGSLPPVPGVPAAA
ncbi:hypothetical protein Aple_100410 [Acrocarpospora pleiomorpha]|uniref:Uncharacterized protein n=1 Tax=Acrocarpospora pleiomorpha TaxID=90975 RepID=A0A5M3Y1E7_9ACTN|nr:hypothetical protein Aple_100410 [Acrocarpospora pleiomorpha]